MGCDGGTIPRRDELVKTKKKPEAKDKDSERLYRWRHCAVSQTRLRSPIVACELGRLYNKDEIITRLIEKSAADIIPHIRGLKDIKEIKLTPNPGYVKSDIKGGCEFIVDQAAEYICPITAVEMNGKSKFILLWKCGCVLSERAIKEIKSETCHSCNLPYDQEDVVILNAADDEMPIVEAAMIARRERVKAAKKAKKDGKRSADEASVSGETSKKKVVKSNDGKNKSSLLVNGISSNVLQDNDFKKIRSSSYSVASDPKASEVYKSLFDTHKTAQKKPTAHWVTCNPQYF